MKLKNFLLIPVIFICSIIINLNVANNVAAVRADNHADFYAYKTNNAEHDEYAYDNAMRLIIGSGETDLMNGSNLGKGLLVMGKDSFSLYPVWNNEKIVATLVVTTYDGEVSGAFSRNFADGLEYVRNLTTESQPLYIVVDDDGTWGVVGRVGFNLNDPHEKKTFSFDTSESRVINGDELFLQHKKVENQLRTVSNYALPFSIAYQQTGSYCYAYALANTLYNLDYTQHTPDRIIAYFNYSNGASFDELTNYLSANGLASEYSDYGYLSMEQVANTIFNNRSYIVIGGKKVNGKPQHACVLYGYSQEMDTYNYWNPWYMYTQTMDAKTRIMIADRNHVYKWDAGYIRNIG